MSLQNDFNIITLVFCFFLTFFTLKQDIWQWTIKTRGKADKNCWEAKQFASRYRTEISGKGYLCNIWMTLLTFNCSKSRLANYRLLLMPVPSKGKKYVYFVITTYYIIEVTKSNKIDNSKRCSQNPWTCQDARRKPFGFHPFQRKTEQERQIFRLVSSIF